MSPISIPTRTTLSLRRLVLNVDELYKEFSERGALSDATSVSDTPWGTREFHVRDPDANGLQFYRWL